ncbi:hypothetical protein [Streptomyces sp. NBC_01538]|uniref:hypothetical protein n=1 Tax=Streptomyces sp. NBC_01538 TaxID=2903897 RepID=UPI0038674A6C
MSERAREGVAVDSRLALGPLLGANYAEAQSSPFAVVTEGAGRPDAALRTVSVCGCRRLGAARPTGPP